MCPSPNTDKPDPEQPAPAEPKAETKADDRRSRFRVPVNMKVLVKRGERSEIGTVTNVSRHGLYFTGFGDYKRGTSVLLQYPYDPAKPASDNFQHADVMRVVQLPDSIKRGFGVKLLDIRVKY